MLGIPALTSILPELAKMKPNSALCFVLAGVSLWLIQLRRGELSSPRVRRITVARGLSSVVGLVGLLTLAEYLLHRNLGIGEDFFSKTAMASGAAQPERMAGVAALGFLLLSAGLLLATTGRAYLAQVFGLLASLDGFVACVGYLFGVQSFYEAPAFSPTAPQTAILLFLMGLATLAARPSSGAMTVVTNPYLGGVLVRRVLPVLLVIVVLLGWLRWRGQAAGLYSTEFGIALLMLGEVVTFVPLLWLSAMRLNQLEQERREGQSQRFRLAAIVESSNDAILSKDLSGTILSWNQGAERLYGYRAVEIVGKPVATLIPEELQEEARQFLREIERGHPVTREDTLRRRKDGSLVSVSLVISPVRDVEGQIVGASTIAHDISERKRAEQELRESEDRHRDLVEHSQDLICTHNLEGELLSANPAAAKVLGCDVTELLRTPMRQMVAPELREQFDQYLVRIKTHGADNGFVAVMTRTGERRIWEYNNTLRAEGVQTAIVRGMARDVTEKKQAEAALRSSEQRYRKLFEKNVAGVAIISMEGQVMDCNDAWARVFGYDSGAACRGCQIAGYYADPAERERLLDELRSNGSFSNQEVQLRRKDGTPFWVLLNSVLVSTGKNESWIQSAVVDITARKLAAEDLRESEERFRLFVEHAPAALAMFDREMRYLHVSHRWRTDYGLGDRDLRGTSHYEVFPEVPERWKEAHRRGLAGEVLRGDEDRFARADGSVQWESWEIRPWYDRTGGIGGIVIFTENITERVQAEQDLRRKDEELSEAQRIARLGSWLWDPKNDVCTWSEELYHIHGLDPTLPAPASKELARLFTPDSWSRLLAAREDGSKTGSPHQLDLEIVRPDGSRRWVSISTEAVRDPAGEIGHIRGTVRDVTANKQAEETLKEYARVVEGLEEMILVVDRNYRYVLANRAFLNFRGMSVEEVVGHTAEEVVGQDVFATQVKGKMDECFLGKVVEYELTYGFPNLGTRDLWVSYFPIEGSAGVDRIACVLQDITERKRSEEALRKSEERFSKAFRNNPLAITISTKAEGRYLDVNDAFLNLLEYERKDVIGRTAAELHFWSEPLDRMEMVRQLEEDGKVAKHHTKYRNAKGVVREAEVWVESIELDGQLCLLGITRDVTEIQQLEAQLRQAQKMEAVGRLAGGIAHDFNNILGIIMGYSDISLGLIAPDNPVNRYLSETKKAAKRAALLTQQLLAFSRKQLVFPKILDLNEVIRNATDMLLRVVGEDIAVDLHPTIPIGSIKADQGQIEQVLMNLVVNARDAMPTGGRISIGTAHADMDDHYVSVHPGAHAGPHVVLAVSDTGCGMDESTQSQIFEPFFTTKGVGEGTGLGLSTVYGIVKQSDGYIVVYSELGRGTTFKIYFPIVREQAEALLPSQEEAEPPPGSETILLVEDDANLRELTAKLLHDGGYRVVEARDAEAALGIMAASGEEIDLLLTDVILPGKSGAELVREAETSHPKLRALFISGYTGDQIGRHGVLVQKDSFLEKPFTKRSLLAKVYAVLRSESARGLPL